MQSTIHAFDIDRSQFKIGSLDSLMQLNETTGRIDGQLDAVCKKIEKIEKDTRGVQEQGEMMYRANYSGDGISYAQYIQTFKWDNMKFQTKRPLNEIAISIQKQMLQKDEAIRKHMEEFTLMKNKISNMTKKDQGNLLVRDFTDEVYTKAVSADVFVETHNSEMFRNVLLVISDDKLSSFKDGMEAMMTRYYENMDAAESRRIRDKAKQKFSEIMKVHEKNVAAKEKIETEEAEAQEKFNATMANGDDEAKEIAQRKFGAEKEKRTAELVKLEALEAEYDTLQENAVDFNVNEADPKEQAQARADPEYMLFLKAE